MTRPQALRILNAVLAVLIVFQVASGLLAPVPLFLVHRISGLTLTAGVLIHLYLNWAWVRTNLLRRRR